MENDEVRDELRRHFELTIGPAPPGTAQRVLAGLRDAVETEQRRPRLEWAAGAAVVVLAVLIVAALLWSRLGIRPQPAGQPETPTARAGAAVVYDPARHVLVLFGGRTDAGSALADTWTWDGSRWMRRDPQASPGPLPEGFHVAYDAANRSVVLAGYPGETWTWDGRDWTRHPTSGPRIAAGDAMAYDPASRTVLLYTTPAPRTHETWSWDGTAWSQLHPSVTADVEEGTMVYDGHQVLLVGTPFAMVQGLETWAWDGHTWSQLTPALRLPVSSTAAFAYDEAHGRLVALIVPADVGGVETWTWDGTTWRKEHPAHEPGTRRGAALVYDAALRSVILYGGVSGRSLGDIWTWDGGDWKEVTR